jgi:excisionase family DNA binding protein
VRKARFDKAVFETGKYWSWKRGDETRIVQIMGRVQLGSEEALSIRTVIGGGSPRVVQIRSLLANYEPIATMTLAEVSERLGISPAKVRSRVMSGSLRGFEDGGRMLINRFDVLAEEETERMNRQPVTDTREGGMEKGGPVEMVWEISPQTEEKITELLRGMLSETARSVAEELATGGFADIVAAEVVKRIARMELGLPVRPVQGSGKQSDVMQN